jgi:antitoxin CptB
MTNKDILKKKIIYRSTHRGNKEMDLLLGRFTKDYINSFSDSELRDLNDLLEINDEILEKWYFKKNHEKLVPVNKVSSMLKRFKF